MGDKVLLRGAAAWSSSSPTKEDAVLRVSWLLMRVAIFSS